MPTLTEKPAGYSPLKAPRGNQISCKSWQQEAALRMLHNNLDEEVAERPQDLVVYGGTRKAARKWGGFPPNLGSPRKLEKNEKLLGKSGQTPGIFKTPQ